MGLIKKNKVEERGIVYLEEEAIEIIPKAPREEVPISEAELPLLGPVQEKAHQIIADAEEKADEIKKEAEKEGYKMGVEEGKREGLSEVSSRLEEALETLNSAIKERKKIIKDAESEILRLALKVAEQIIRSEVSLHRDVCLNIVSEAISRVSDREQIIVKVNRDDLDTIKKYKDRIASLVDGVKSLSILEDSSVEPGGCVIESNLGFVDARIGTKLKAIEEAFKKMQKTEEE